MTREEKIAYLERTGWVRDPYATWSHPIRPGVRFRIREALSDQIDREIVAWQQTRVAEGL